ncbi:hypothetical protein V8E54_001765 [Elaphomyces granulatus]
MTADDPGSSCCRSRHRRPEAYLGILVAQFRAFEEAQVEDIYLLKKHRLKKCLLEVSVEEVSVEEAPVEEAPVEEALEEAPPHPPLKRTLEEQVNTSTFHTSHYDPVFLSSSHRPNLRSSRFKFPIKDDAKPNDHPRGGLDDCNAQKRSENTADIESNDERRVRSALSKLDPHILLQQLDSPSPPKWQTVLTDWVSVTIPLPIFREWNGKFKDWDHLRYEYDVSTQRLMIKCMPSNIHASIPSDFLVQVGLETLKLSDSAQRALRTGSTTNFNGFDYPNMNKGAKKEADAYLKVQSRRHPAIVVESGWAESERDLEDARLWLLGTSPPVARVILVDHVEGKILHDNRSEDEKTERKLMDAEVEELLADGTSLYCDKEEPADGEEKTVTARSNEKHAQDVLINKLLSANSENNLMKPLLGPVESRLSVFRRVRDGDNPENIICKTVATDEGNAVQQIYREFEADIYPSEPTKSLSIPWGELVAPPPTSFTPRDLRTKFSLNLQKFHEMVKEAIEDQIDINAHTRAIVILERHEEIPRYPSHSEIKKRTGSRMLDGDGPYAPSPRVLKNHVMGLNVMIMGSYDMTTPP